MRILFAGSPLIAVEALLHLHVNIGVALLLCKPDAFSGRKVILTPPPTKIMAQQLGIRVIQPQRLDTHVEKDIHDSKIDLLVCFAYGKIFTQSFIDLFPLGAINLHPSLLPKWRGPSPINSTILHGDTETGITVQRLALKMDAGDIIIQKKIALTGCETAIMLSSHIAKESGPILVEAIRCLTPPFPCKIVAQNEKDATYCGLLKKEDGLINFDRGAVDIERHIRAMQPSPGSYTYLNGSLLYLHRASFFSKISNALHIGMIVDYNKASGVIIQTASGQLAVTQLQLAGKKILDHRDFINGHAKLIGQKLG